VWISNLEGKSLSVYDVETGAIDEARTVDLLGSPLFSSFGAAGDRLYVPLQNPDSLVTVDTATGAVIGTLNFTAEQCRAPHGTLLLDDDALAVVCEGDHVGPGMVARIDLGGEQPALDEVFEVGVYPDDLIFIPEGS
jgi:hypothetical protein